MKERFKLKALVYLIFIKDGRVLLLRRFNTGFHDGQYSLPAGHLEEDETLVNAAIRETEEETSIKLSAEDLQLSHVMHVKESEYEQLSFYFKTEKWEGEPKIMEPEKCDDLSWYNLSNLPKNIPPYIEQALKNIQKNIIYSEFGWTL